MKNEDPKQASFDLVAEFYSIDLDNLKAEKQIFENIKSSSAYSSNFLTPGQSVASMHNFSLNETLPHFWDVATTLATIPATSCSAERSFSCLRRLKTYLRSTMGSSRLSNLAVINIERHATSKVDVNAVINIFGKRKARAKYFL